MRTITSCMIILLFLLAITVPVLALKGPVVYYNRYYYVVDSTDPTENTGAKVCAKVGTPLIGYTAKILNVCSLFHPTATQLTGSEGSNSGFYCDGPPQRGICANQKNTCNVCPGCNQGTDENTVISDLYREMYVECGKPVETTATTPTPRIPSVLDDLRPAPTPPAFTPTFFTGLYSGIRLSVLGMYWQTLDKQSLNKYLDGRWGCEFYQYPLANQKPVDCTRPADAEAFCRNRLGSSDAVSAYCGADGAGEGLIVCSESCTAGSAPAPCPADPSRKQVRGTDAPAGTCGSTTSAGTMVERAGTTTGGAVRTTTPGVNLNRPTLQTTTTTVAPPGTTKTVSVKGSSAIKTVTVAGEGLSGLTVTGTQLNELPKGVPQPEGQLYQYTELEPERFTTISSASIEFVIPSSWLTAQNIPSSSIVLKRFNNGEWTALPTVVEKEENGQVTYKADSPGLSIFWEGALFALHVDYPEQPKLGTGPNVCPRACAKSQRDSLSTYNCDVTHLGTPNPDSCPGTIMLPQNSQPSACSCYTVETQAKMTCPSQCTTGSATCMIASGVPGKTGVACEGVAQGTLNMPCMCVVRNGEWRYAYLGPVLTL